MVTFDEVKDLFPESVYLKERTNLAKIEENFYNYYRQKKYSYGGFEERILYGRKVLYNRKSTPSNTFIINSQDKSGYINHRRRENFRRLYLQNITENGTFVSLTFASELSIVDAKKELNKFIKRLVYRERRFSKYTWKMERGEENNRLHFHIIFYDVPFFPIEKFTKIWGLGHCWMAKIYNKHLAMSYLRKYFTKSSKCEEYTGKILQSSLFLKKPDLELSRVIDLDKPAGKVINQYSYKGYYGEVICNMLIEVERNDLICKFQEFSMSLKRKPQQVLMFSI